MKKLFTYLLVLVASSLLACTEPYDDTAIRSEIEDLKDRVTKLEELCNQMNTNISALQGIVNALQKNDYITNVAPITKNGEEIGYTISFASGKTITIYHGKDGKDGANGANGADGQDGYTPVIGVKQDTDGIYYWTIDGEWLLDENGNKVKAVGTDGKDGQDGQDGQNGTNGNDGQNGANGADGKDAITPLLKIEDDYWYISYDNGASWTQLGKATGEKGDKGDQGDKGDKGDKGDTGLVGDSMFTDVDYSNDEYVLFTLSNGTQVKVPTWYAFEELRKLCNQMNSNIESLQKIVTALQNNDYVTKVEPVVDNGTTIGYTIYFTKSNPVTIYHGQNGADGKDGYTPIIGVKQDTDGIYYWTLDGEWLTDASGNKIKANGIDGAQGEQGVQGDKGDQGETGAQGPQGEQGITPQLKIEDGKWFISYDNGSTWNEVGQATGDAGADGKDGDAFFKSVDSSNSNYVVITLADGTQIKLPTWAAFEKLQKLCNTMNSNIEALEKIVKALQQNDYVTKVEPVVEDGKTIGYTIYFTKSNPVTIYHGENGADGYTPVIGVKQHTDGIYYWTLDDEWLTDASGNKIKANGIDGAQGEQGAQGPQGEQGITPQLKIENGNWFISYDNGTTWNEVGQATGDAGADGKDGDAFFKSVDSSNSNYVVITLADGTQIKLPTWAAFEKLQKLCNTMNSNIEALEKIVKALQQNDYVTKVEPVVEDGKTIGYTIYLTKSNPVTIYHGENGADGYTPVIGVKQHTDGIYYWTLDGEWLTDASGNKIKANGIDGAQGPQGDKGDQGETGAQGEQGITPQLKIENGKWFISYDNGSTWSELGQATGDAGKDGDAFFQGVSQDDQFVYFTLADGTVITLPKGASLEITFAESDLVVMSPNSTRTIRYSVQSVTENVTVEVTSSSDIRAKVVADDATGKSGHIDIKSGSIVDEYSKVIVFVSNGEKVIMKSISFELAGLEISDGATQSILPEGGNVSLNFLTNTEWELSIPTEAQSWIHLAPQTRAMVAHSVSLVVEPNTSLTERSATITINSADGKLSIAYNIAQGIFNMVSATTPQNAGWKASDLLSVFAANTKNQKFQYLGTAGAASGDFEAVTTPSGSATTAVAHYAVYPYKTSYSLSADGALSIPFAATQNYVAGGYAADLNTMVAVSSGVTDTNLSLQPVCAYLCVKLWGKDHSVKSITLTSKGGEALSGNGVVTPHYNAVPTCVLSGSANSIKLNCGEVKVGTSETSATEFWFVVPPVALAEGYTIKVVEFYGGEQTFEQEATTFVSGTIYNIGMELTIASDGPGMGVGGWGDGGNVEGEI